MGAIYALEQILHTSSPDRRAIIELLVSYVLGHATLAERRDNQPEDDASLDDLPHLRDWAPDVQAAVVVLSRRPRTTLREAVRGTGDDHFHQPKLKGADLSRAHLERADLGDATLIGTKLIGAFLTEADLGGARLCGANLAEADLGGAGLRYADLSNTDLRGALLEHAEGLEDATLAGAHANEQTTWPPNLSPADHGVEIDDVAAGIVDLGVGVA